MKPAVFDADKDAEREALTTAKREVVRETVTVLVLLALTVGAGLELPTGCAPPPAQAPGGVHGAHVPEVPAQRMLPGVVDA